MEDRTILVTGATSGIGKATAVLFAQLGAKVIAVARGEERGQVLVEEIRGNGGEAIFVSADMSVEEEIREMVEAAVSEYGGLDFAFNNAAIFVREPCCTNTTKQYGPR